MIISTLKLSSTRLLFKSHTYGYQIQKGVQATVKGTKRILMIHLFWKSKSHLIVIPLKKLGANNGMESTTTRGD